MKLFSNNVHAIPNIFLKSNYNFKGYNKARNTQYLYMYANIKNYMKWICTWASLLPYISACLCCMSADIIQKVNCYE